MINYNNLKKQEYLEEIKKLAQDMINNDEFVEAYRLSSDLLSILRENKDFKQNYFDLYKQYALAIVKLRWVALPLIREEEVINLFQNHFVKSFYVADYNIFYKLRATLLGIVGLDNRDNFKKQLISSLLKNQESISTKKIIINQLTKEPTVSNWLLYYDSEVGNLKTDKLKKAQFLSNNQNFQGLESKEKNNLKKLFKLYERLKISSQDLEGFEEDIPIDDEGQEGYVRGGVFEPLPKMTEQQRLVWEIAQEVVRERENSSSTNELENLKKTAASYPINSLERKAIEEEIWRIEK